MRSTVIAICCLLVVAGAAFAQSDRGTVTGSITDPAGAVIPGAAIEVKNIDTGAVYQVKSSSTGNYTLSQLPAGKYQMSSSVSGFKQFLRTGITVLVAQTLRIDISLEVGSISETVTVSEDAPLLRTESGELAENVASKTMDELPVLGFSGYIRDPFAVTELVPGALYNPATRDVRINGAPSNTQSVRIEGQEATDGVWTSYTTFSQPSVDSVEEFAVQTSNFAAEYGQTGGGLFNMTMKSGKNKLHGSAYDYWYNEALNASTPYGGRKDRQRRNDYGFTLGGPVYIPKLYNGHDKTFFFFNWEQFREKSVDNTDMYTVPTLRMRQGDFGEVLTSSYVTTADGVTNIKQNTIYRPGTEHPYVGKNGITYTMRDPYPNNKITDPLNSAALAIQKLIPEPAGPYKNDLTNNYLVPWDKYNYRTIPSVKIDHSFGARSKLSGFWSATHITANTMCDGFTSISPITMCMLTFVRSQTVRLNYDFTLAPSKLLHLGAGLQKVLFTNDTTFLNFNQQTKLGIAQPAGAQANRFPSIRGLLTSYGGAGGAFGLGPPAQYPENMYKPTANASLTWVKSNHTYKFGAELRIEAFLTNIMSAAYGAFNFSNTQTGIPDSAYVKTLSVGFPYASFLLGQLDSGSIGAMATPHMGKSAWALFAQDSWKVSRKFTLDYGLRWDYQGYLRETYGRLPNFSPTTPNPRVNNLPGAMVLERNGVTYSSVYPFAFGPRLGSAYQITPKTVFRAGWGISYGQTATDNGVSATATGSNSFSAPSYGAAWRTLDQGAPAAASGLYVWPNVDPGFLNTSPTPASASPGAFDKGAGRPPRQIQWSVGLQREITKNLMVEASYVGNRGAWWEGDELIRPNAISAERLASFGLSLDSADDRSLLAGTLTSAAAKSRINPVTKLPFSTPPYTGFPVSQTVAQSLRPFPQFTTITYRWAPLGRTWYDSLQAKVTKRFSKGLDLASSFTWQKELVMGSETTGLSTGGTGGVVNDAFNRSLNKYISNYSRPHVLVTSVNYTLPKLALNRMLSLAIRDWRITLLLNYSSGRPIAVPTVSSSSVTSNYTFQSTFANRVAGQPLFLRTVKNADGTKTTTPISNINDRSSYNPLTDFVLNPAAWQDPPAGQFSTSTAYYNDYRYPRHPEERLSIGRDFRIKEGVTFNIRADFDNILNRSVLGDSLLTSTSAIAPQSWNPSGTSASGFGRYNAPSANAQRHGLIVGRFSF